MPRVGKNPQTPKKPTVANITCLACGQTKKTVEFPASSSVFNAGTGRVQYCRECCINMSCDENGNINIEKLKSTLQKIDKPFLPEILQSSYEESKNGGNNTHPLKLYFKTINSLSQYKDLGWNASILDRALYENSKNNDKTNKNIDIVKLQEKYGYGFTEEEYLNFERKYKKLSRGYKEKTELHTERLITYIIHKVKEEMATANGQVGEAEKWAKLAQADATAAKLNVSQLSKSDITGGIDLLPQLVEAVEQYASVIPLLPKVLEQPYDDVDLILWANINYLRHLEDKSFIQYQDIWNFYDKMLEEFYKQKGFSVEQIKEEKLKRNNIFRDLGTIYVEPLYEHPDDFIEESSDSDEFV
jgi:hypothetical protein